MVDSSAFTDRLLVKQKSMFRQAAARGFTQDLIHGETKISTTSLSDWANGKAKLSLAGLLRIAEMKDFPAELLTLLFQGTGRVLCDEITDDGDHDSLASNCIDFASRTARARHPNSPGGVEIVECEDNDLRACRQQLRARE
jgi:transcriptional regulator with XRE-family HTH domain